MVQPPTAAPHPHPRGNEIVELPPLNEEIANRVGGYWDSTIAKNLFAPNSPCTRDLDVHLSLLIDLLELLINEPKRRNAHVNRATEEECQLNANESHVILMKCMYLRESYLFALQKMNDETWEDCCRNAINKMTERGFTFVNSYMLVQNWNIQFRDRYFFPHPNLRVELRCEYSPRLLDSFPEAEFVINQWASENIKNNLSIERLAQYVRSETFVKDLHKQHAKECRENQLTSMPINQIRKRLNVGGFSVYAGWRFIKYPHFSFSDRRKTY